MAWVTYSMVKDSIEMRSTLSEVVVPCVKQCGCSGSMVALPSLKTLKVNCSEIRGWSEFCIQSLQIQVDNK